MKRGLLLVLGLLCLAGNAGAQGKSGGNWGLMFDMSGLLGNLGAFGDGFQSGVGVKFVLGGPWALRALGNVLYRQDSAAGTSQTGLGFGLGGEFRLASGPVFPYLGTQLGFDTASAANGGTVTSQTQHFYWGLLAGGEVQLMPGLSLFCEYNALFIWGDTFVIQMGQTGGAAKNALLGLIFYF